MKKMLESIYGPGYFENINGLKEDIQAIKFVLFRMFSKNFKELFENFFHVFGNFYLFCYIWI